MQISFTLHRNDSWIPIENISKVYSIDKLEKFFGKKISLQFHPIIKKALLCSNFEFRYSNYAELFFLLFVLIFYNLILYLCDFDPKDELPFCIFIFFIVDFPIIYDLVVFTILFILNNARTQREMKQYLKYFISSSSYIKSIRNCEGNDSYSVHFEDNFDLVITKTLNETKAKHNVTKEVIVPYYNYSIRDNEYFEYVINIPNRTFKTFHYTKLLQPKEIEIIRDIMTYLYDKNDKYLKDGFYFVVKIIVLYGLLCFQKELVTFGLSIFYFFITIVFSFIFDYNRIAIKKSEFIKYLDDLNKEIIKCGYYLSESEYLISLFAIKRNCYYTIEEAQREVERIKMY